MNDVAVAIASFNTRALLRVVCGAVRITAPGAAIVVVDTGSSDGSREWAAGRAWVRLEALDGLPAGAEAHGAALDRALAIVDRPFLCALDSDAVPCDPAWLADLRSEIDRPHPGAAVGTTKDPGEASAWKRLRMRIFGPPRGPAWRYLRPNRALYRVETLRRLGLSFRPAPRSPGGSTGTSRPCAVGEALAAGLDAAGEAARLLDPRAMEARVAHLRHATMALNPHLFPGVRARDVRSARARIERFLSSDWAKRCAAAADEA